MSHLSDNLAERNFDVNRASTSQQSTSQPFRSKSSIVNKTQEHPPQSKQTKKKSPKYSAMNRNKQPQVEGGNSSQNLPNPSTTRNMSDACQNLSVNSGNQEIDQGNNSKRKNAKKKERIRLNKLKMPTPENPLNIPHSSQSAPGHQHQQQQQYPMPNEYTSLQDFIARQMNAMCLNANSRYMENLNHHPQYQVSQNMQCHNLLSPQLATSLPNTPSNYLQQRPKSVSIPNSPILQPDYMSPKCFQNVMQHPLLCQSYSEKFQRNHNLGSPQGSTSAQGDPNTTPKRNRNKKKANNDIKFDPYLSLEDVESGLKTNTFIEGVIRINPKQFQHSYVSNIDRNEQDILIDGLKNRNRALEGDIVVVQLLDTDTEEGAEENKQKKGKVVYIKEKVHRRICIGNLRKMPDNNRQRALFRPRDFRIPRLNIPFTSWPDNFYNDHKKYENTLFLAEIVDWFDARFAMGKIIRNIGQSGDMVSETKAILAQTDLDITPFGSDVRHLYPGLDYKISQEELSMREDCRKLCLFSIDPSNCRDIDDAVSCRALENGNYEIGVHIADVAHYLTEGTILDERVAEKATTIYLVEKAYHMLPDDLCVLCSLFPGVDKLAFSVFWEITKDAQVLNHRFAKTVINSCAQLSYDHAQAVLEDREESEANFPEIYNKFAYNDLYKVIKVLGSLSAIFRKNRFDGGALRIDQPKVAFHLNAGNGLPESFWIYESKESHQLIEEFMLLANMTVAKKIFDDHPKLAFLRSHPPPNGHMLKELAKSLKPMGIELDISSAGDLHKSMLPHCGPSSTDQGKIMVLNMLCAKPMARAKYFCAGDCQDDDFSHYALNVPLYTHFTSPIRRYADIMVHRLLAASLNYTDVPKWETDKVRMIAAQCNKQKYNSKKASELSTELYTSKYIEMHSPVVTEAAVVEVREKYIDVIIIAMGLNRRIFFNNDFPGKYQCIKHEGGSKLSKMELTWDSTNDLPETTQIIQVFSILQVELYKDDNQNGKIDTKLVRPQ